MGNRSTHSTGYHRQHQLTKPRTTWPKSGSTPIHCPKANSFEHPNPNSRGKIRIYAIHIAPITY